METVCISVRHNDSFHFNYLVLPSKRTWFQRLFHRKPKNETSLNRVDKCVDVHTHRVQKYTV